MSKRTLIVGPSRNPNAKLKWYEATIDVEQDGKLLCELIVARGRTEEEAKRLRNELLGFEAMRDALRMIAFTATYNGDMETIELAAKDALKEIGDDYNV